MFYFLKNHRGLLYCVNFLTVKNRNVNTIKSYIRLVNCASEIRFSNAFQSKHLLEINDQFGLILSRNKYNIRKKKQGKQFDEESSDEEEEEEDEDDEDDVVEKGGEVKVCKVKSLRIDLLLKTLLGISRKKIEESFYQNKIRVNGKLVLKKSQNAKLNDEIDLVKNVDDASSNTIVVGRIKILNMEQDPESERIVLKAWRSKSLKINNYQGRNAWTEPSAEE